MIPVLNEFQTPLDSDLVKDLPKECYSELIEILETVEFANWMVSDQRGYARDRDRDDQGRIIVDISQPHIIEDVDFFRRPAIHFKKHGRYTLLSPNRNPNSEYGMFWKEEQRRWKDGLVRESDGEWIPGAFYFYLNYAPIWKVVERKSASGKVRGDRVYEFCNFWVGDYLFYHYLEQAQENGAHAKMLKTRGVGASYKLGALSPCNMYTKVGLPNFHLASDKTFLEGDKGVFGKVINVLDWIAEHTPFPKLRLVDRALEKQLGYKDEYGVNKGYKSSVFGISLKDNPDKARGVRGPLIHYEEDGLFPNLEKAWGVNRKAVEDGDIVYGIMFALGCVCAGTKVWTRDGRYINIEELNFNDGILGFDNEVVPEDIENINPPNKKQCVEISTKYRSIRCSIDHPILCRIKHSKRTPTKEYPEKREYWYSKEWKDAGDIKKSDVILCADEINVWGDKTLFDARLVGMLIGDGSYGMRRHYDKIEFKTPSFSNCDEELNNYVLSNYDASVELERPTKDGRSYKEIRIRGMIKRLKDIGIAGQSKDSKRLPIDYLNLTKLDSSLLLAGLFDTDGYVHYRDSNPCSVSIAQSSEEMLKQIKILLEKFGIRSIISKVMPRIAPDRKDKNPWYVLTIATKHGLNKFKEHIPLMIKYKINNLNKIIDLVNSKELRKLNKFDNTVEERVCSVVDIGLQDIYNITASGSHTYLANNIITHNTGGTSGADFAGSEKLFYNPDAYNIYGIPNRFDKNTNGKVKCGFFWAAYMNRARCYHDNGESDVIKALCEILLDRFKVKYGSSDPNAITQKKAEEPIVPQEAVMRTEGTIFPISDLKDYLSEVAPDLQRFTSAHYVGRLGLDSGGDIQWKLDDSKTPIRDFPLKDGGNREGCVEIFEMPHKRPDGQIDPWRYIAGIDPIDYDEGNYTNSLGSIFIFDLLKDRIVAEYTGRSKFANDFYEQCLRLLKFYNAQANYENNLKGLFTYFDKNNALNYLCDTPKVLRDMELVRGDLIGNRSKGSAASKNLNAWARKLQADWQMEKAFNSAQVDDKGEPISGTEKLNLQTIRSVAYLKECIAWNPDINTDRVSAMGMCMILREDRAKIELRENEDRHKTIYEDPFFKRFGSTKNKRKPGF